MKAKSEPITVTGLTHGMTRVLLDLHLSGGMRARGDGQGEWKLGPILAGDRLVVLKSLPIEVIGQIARQIGLTIMGGDQIDDFDGPLPSRAWAPLGGSGERQPQAADMWSSIAFHAHESGNVEYARLAQNIACSFRAAGIRLRDASDGYHTQLRAALITGREAGSRFSNVPLADIHLAFHSVLTELASTRDYLAGLIARKLGANSKTDSMRKLADWLKKPAQQSVHRSTVISGMLRAYDKAAPDPWLFELTDYRNKFIHRGPLGTSECRLVFELRQMGTRHYHVMTLPLPNDDAWAPGADALAKFLQLFRNMEALLKRAAAEAPYSAEPPELVAQ